jgi:hypothetical protein
VANFAQGVRRPQYVYRQKDDPFYRPSNPDACSNRYGGRCIMNNAVPMTYLWRERPTTPVPAFSARDTLNESIQPENRKWAPGDVVPGYILTYPSDSRADIRGKATYDADLGIWTLELARRLVTSDPDHDVVFDPASGAAYAFSVAVFDASTRNHWGTEPVLLQFAAKPAAR